MNEEEAIKILNLFIKSVRSDLEEAAPSNFEDALAIEIILKQNEELKKQNEKLLRKNDMIVEAHNELSRDRYILLDKLNKDINRPDKYSGDRARRHYAQEIKSFIEGDKQCLKD